MKIRSLLCGLLMLVFAGYALAASVFGITTTSYFTKFPISYTTLILALIMPFIGFFFYLFIDLKKKKTLIRSGVVTFISILVLGFFTYLQYTSDSLIYGDICRHIFKISFASKLPIGQVLLILLLVFNLISLIVSFIKYKKLNKRD